MDVLDESKKLKNFIYLLAIVVLIYHKYQRVTVSGLESEYFFTNEWMAFFCNN